MQHAAILNTQSIKKPFTVLHTAARDYVHW